MTLSTRIFGVVAVAVGLFLALFVLDSFWDSLVISGICLGVIMLSIVLTTGIGGTISLCQGSFAAIGAFATAQLVQHNWPVMGAMVVGALVAAAVGAVLGLPGDPAPRHLRRAGHAGLRVDVRRAAGPAHLGVGWRREPPAPGAEAADVRHRLRVGPRRSSY